MDIEVKLSDRTPNSAKVSVRVELSEGGLSIQNIFARVEDGKQKLTFPLSKAHHYPIVTLRGALKQAVSEAIWDAYNMSPEQSEPLNT